MAVAIKDVPNPMLHLAAQVLEVRERAEELDKQLKETNKLKEELEQQLIEMMMLDDVDKFVYAGKTFFPSVRLWASLKAETKEEAIEWLKSSGFADLVKEQVNTQSLSSLVKELKENDEMPEEFEQFLNVTEKISLNVRKGRS